MAAIPAGVLTGYMVADQLQPEFRREETGSLDASEFIAAGSCKELTYGRFREVILSLAFRSDDSWRFA